MKRAIQLVIFFIFMALVFTPKTDAFETREGDLIEIDSETTVPGTLFAGGKRIEIKGVVDGDLFCGAQIVKVSGKVDGDVICGAQTIEISGEVTGNVRAGAQNINISGTVERNISLGGQNISLDKDSSIGGEALMGGQQLTLEGSIGKGVMAGAQMIDIQGTVGGDVKLAVEDLALGDEAVVEGDLVYTSDNKAMLDEEATVSGELTQKIPEKAAVGKDKPIFTFDKTFDKPSWSKRFNLFGIVMYLVLGWLVVTFASKFTQKTKNFLTTNSLKTFGIGFLSMIVAPVVLLLTVITIIGIPIAILLLLVWIVVLMVSRLFVALVIGEKILASFSPQRAKLLGWNVLVGVPVLWIVFKVPVLGWMLMIISVIWGTGGIILALKPEKKSSK